MYIIHFYGSGFTTLIRFNYWILCETVLPGQGDVPRLAEVDFTDTDHDVEILEEQTQFCTNHEKHADMCSLDRLELTASALNDRLHELKIPH